MAALHNLVKALGAKFSLKDPSQLGYFLGIEVIPTSAGLFLSQQKYVRDLLKKTNMLDAKGVFTALSSSETLTLYDDSRSIDAILYRQLIDSLQYLSIMHLCCPAMQPKRGEG